MLPGSGPPGRRKPAERSDEQGYFLSGIFVAATPHFGGCRHSCPKVRTRGLDRWIFTYVRERSSIAHRRASGPVHLLLCIADHFEPGNGGVTPPIARGRVRSWVEDYPRLCQGFRDSDGRPPRHTFFYPIEMYDEAELDALVGLCRLGLGEVEIHLHHDGDTSENLRQTLLRFKELLARRHGLLARHRETGALTYGFVHGNWALDNSRPDGRCCGVNNEIDILRETGCYADFTLPSAPSPTQTRKINSIYYAIDDPARSQVARLGNRRGEAAAPARRADDDPGAAGPELATAQVGILPRIENGCLQGNQPPTPDRLDAWLRARVQVPARPDWYFVKLHTHGAPEGNQRVLSGKPMVEFHLALARRASEDPNFRFHYVTAREMYNLVRAAEAGWQGTVAQARDYELIGNVPDTLSYSRNRGRIQDVQTGV